MKRNGILIAGKKLLITSLICSSVLFAAQSEYKYEVTPMIGGAVTEGNLDLDRNYANAGVSLGINLDEDSMFDQIELGFLRTLGDVDYKNSTANTSVSRFFYKLN
jgi:OOP family OmpA-OmpF porin